MDLELRAASDDDLPTMLAINEAEVPAVGAVTLEHLSRLVSVAWSATVAVIDDDIAGFCVVFAPGADYHSVNYRWFEERYDDHVYLDRVVVRPEFRGRGVGRALYGDVEARTSAAWFTLEVNVEPRNDASLAFHDRLGFGEVGRQRTPYGTVVSLMAKPLHVTGG